MFPAVNARSAGSTLPNGVGGSGYSVAAVPSASRASVQAAMAQTTSAPSSSSLGALPRLSSAARLREQLQAAPADAVAQSTAPGAGDEYAPAPAASGARASSRSVSSMSGGDPSSSGPALGLRVTDARLESMGGLTSHVPQTAVWAQLAMDALNEGLSAPLLPMEAALNRVLGSGRKARSPEERLAEAAHRAIEVSRLVPHYPLEFGTSLLGGGSQVLFLTLENVAPVARASTSTIISPLTAVEGEVSWRARLPTQLDTPVEHWAATGGSSSDEERYHSLCCEREVFTVRPSSGKLAPGQSMVLEIAYHPKFIGEHVLPLLVQVRGGKHFSLVLKAATVQQLPSTFSFTHLRELTTTDSHEQQQQALLSSDKQEESKEQSSSGSLSGVNPFLPAAVPASHEHTFHPVPIGLALEDTPLQTFPLFNNSPDTLLYRVQLAPLRAFAKDNYDFGVLSLVGAEAAAAGEDEPEYLEGIVPPHSVGLLRWRFRPLEAKAYACAVDIGVRAESGGPEELQRVTLRGVGILPDEWATRPFPPASSAPPHQAAPTPGQLLSLSCEELALGDVPRFSRSSRLLTLRSLAPIDDSQPPVMVEFAFVHNLRLHPSRWNASLASELALRRAVDPDGEAEEEVGELDQYDPDESVHVTFTPPCGVLAPGTSLQVRCDVHAGAQAVILERSVQVLVRAVLEEADATSGNLGGFGQGQTTRRTVAEPVDTFGYNRTPSVSLAHRTAISSSQPGARKLRRTLYSDRGLIECVTGVGQGLAGADVRVDYPPRVSPPLHSNTITRRVGGGGGSGTNPATAHLADTMSELSSIPSRATWFADSAAPVAALERRGEGVLHLALRARVLPVARMEADEATRCEALPGQRERERLPQQPRTELTTRGATVAQRFCMPPVELVVPTAPAAAAVPSAGAVSAIEAALHSLLRSGLEQTSVRDSFGHLQRAPVPFFSELLDGTASVTTTPPSPFFPNDLTVAPAHFRALAGTLLRDTLGSLLAEASASDSDFGLDRPLPKTFVKRTTTNA